MGSGVQLLVDQPVEVGAEGVVGELLDDVVGEGVEQEGLGLALRDAPAAEVEDVLGLELAGGGAVRALHIVGVDLQLGLREERGAVAEQHALAALVGVGLLGLAVDEHLAVEDASGLAVEDASVELVREAAGLGVVEQRVVVHVLLAVDEVEAVEVALAVRGVRDDGDGVADEPAAQRVGVVGERAGAALVRVHGVDVRGVLALGLELEDVDARVALYGDLGDAVGEGLGRGGRVVGLDD